MSNFTDFFGSGGSLGAIAFNTAAPSLRPDWDRNATKTDAGQGNSSYFDNILKTNLTGILYYTALDSLQWTVTPSDVFATATNFIDRSTVVIGATLYVVAYDSSPLEGQLASIDIVTGTITPIGSVQALTNVTFDCLWNTLNGTTLSYYGTNKAVGLDVDIVTGVFTEYDKSIPTNLNGFYISSFVGPSVDYNQLRMIDHRGECSLYGFSATGTDLALVNTATLFAGKVYIMNNTGVISYIVEPEDYKAVMTEYVSNIFGTDEIEWEHV